MTAKLHRHAAAAAAALTAALCSPLPAQTVYPTGTTIWLADEAYAGVTLFANPGGEAVLIDMAGRVVNTWRSPVPGERLGLVEPLPNGHILCTSFAQGSTAQTVLELDWASNVAWAYVLPASVGQIHHDIQRLPNGNTLLLCSQTVVEPGISPLPLTDDFLLEVTPAGTIAWSWLTYQHFEEFGFDALAKQLIAAQGGDWAHTNAAGPLPANSHGLSELAEGNVLVSQRFTNIIFIIDKATGAIVWQAGPVDHLTLGQHAPYMIPQGLTGAGNILVFDNGSGTGYPLLGRSPGRSRIVEIDPLDHSYAWTYDATNSGLFNRTFFSDIVSNAERLPNGNTMVCSGVRGRLFEVNTRGKIVWEYMSPFASWRNEVQKRSVIYRAHRLPRQWGQ